METAKQQTTEMRDPEVRAAVRQMLAALHGEDPATRVVEEMGIWSGSARIDIAVINGELAGFELKSERDTLRRLESQAALYNGVFDKVTIVAATRHIEAALDAVPRWWGLIQATDARGELPTLKWKRRAKRNPAVNTMQVARLLWRDELLSILERHGIDSRVRTARADSLVRRLVEQLPPRTVRLEVRETLKNRQDWLGQPVSHQ